MYCTLTDLQARLNAATLLQLADADGDGRPDTAIIEAAIADADAEIDAYLGNRYVVPFAEPPAVLRLLSTLLAINNLFARLPSLVSAEHQERAEEARRLLHHLAEDQLDISQCSESSLRNFLASTSQELPRVFSREKLRGF